MINYRRHYWWISLAIVVVSVVVAWIANYNSKETITALVDVTLTTIALLVAILEIAMVRSISEESRTAVHHAVNRLNEIFSVADITHGIRLSYDIQKYLQSGNNIAAHIRLQDLKQIVIPLKNDKRFHGLESSKKLNDSVASLAIDINNLNSNIITSKKGLDVVKINENLENLVTILIEYDNHIKMS